MNTEYGPTEGLIAMLGQGVPRLFMAGTPPLPNKIKKIKTFNETKTQKPSAVA